MGAYVDDAMGPALVTSDSDIFVCFLLSYQVAECMRRGEDPHGLLTSDTQNSEVFAEVLSGAVVCSSVTGSRDAAYTKLPTFIQFSFVIDNSLKYSPSEEKIHCI